ncbi:hypothetical protein [Aeromicrobium sp. Root495]|uniref:hypothetical protein n=1 Tax=Aeromicrobium sp. Root495 TaxID=1736550 RepID=UPI000B314539|nr:hypothetical protein [Aeromicrobium sp. Root495]
MTAAVGRRERHLERRRHARAVAQLLLERRLTVALAGRTTRDPGRSGDRTPSS